MPILVHMLTMPPSNQCIGPFSVSADLGGMQFDISDGQVDMQVGMAVRGQRWNKTVGGQAFGDFFRTMAFDKIGTVDVKVPVSFNLGTLSPSDFPTLRLSPVVTFKYAMLDGCAEKDLLCGVGAVVHACKGDSYAHLSP